MSGDPAEFTLNIQKFIQQAGTKANAFVAVFIQDFAQELIFATPGPGNSVAQHPKPGQPTGFLRGSWIASIGDVGKGTGSADPSGAKTIGEVNFVAAQMKFGDVFYLVNTAAYAMRQEFGFIGIDSAGRNIHQEGRAFVRGTVAKANVLAKEALDKVEIGKMGGLTGGIFGGRFVGT